MGVFELEGTTLQGRDFRDHLNKNWTNGNQVLANLNSLYDINAAKKATFTPSGVMSTLAELNTKYPNGEVGIFVIADTGHWYYWNGNIWKDGGIYQSAGIAENSIKTNLLADGTVTGSKLASAVQSSLGQAIANDKLTYTITDNKNNRSWIEIDPDGNPTTNSAQRLAPKVRPELLPDQGAQTGVSFSVVDSDGKMSDLAIDDDGRLLIDTVADQATRANLMTKTDMSVIRAIGDSLTDGGGGDPNPSWTDTLKADLPVVKVENFGISGQASGMVTFRMGLNHVTITEIDGGKLPGDGSNVAVTFKSSIGDGRNMLNGGAFCKLGGVQAYFVATDTNKGTIKLSKPGNDVSIVVPAVLTPDTDVDRYSDGKTDLDKMAIIWMGKNDSIFATGKGWENGCMANINAVINSLSPDIKSYIVIGITNDSTEGIGTSRYDEIVKFNKRLADLTPGYIDLRSYMVHQCIYDMGLTPTEDDLASMAVDAPPAQIVRPDHTHFIADARPFESRYILKQLQMRGWYKNDNATKTA